MQTRGVFDKETRRKPLAFAVDAVRYGGDSVGRFSEFQKRFETKTFLKRVNVLALQVLNGGLYCLGICQFDHANWKFFEFRKFRCSEATCPGYNFVLAFLQFAYQKRRQNPLRLKAGRLLCH